MRRKMKEKEEDKDRDIVLDTDVKKSRDVGYGEEE